MKKPSIETFLHSKQLAWDSTETKELLLALHKYLNWREEVYHKKKVKK